MKKNTYIIYACGIFLLSLLACQKKLYVKDIKASQSIIEEQIPVDSVILNAYLPYKTKLDSQMNRVIGYSAISMNKLQSPVLLTNFFADAIAQACQRRDIKFDIAFPSTNGGIRTSIPQGAITVQTIFELMPFENELVLLSLKGTDVIDMVNHIITSGGQPVSGIRIKAKEGQIHEITVNGEMIDTTKTYQVLTSDYLAGGGDGITAFKKPMSRINLNIKVRDMLFEYVEAETKSGRNLNAYNDGRIDIQ